METVVSKGLSVARYAAMGVLTLLFFAAHVGEARAQTGAGSGSQYVLKGAYVLTFDAAGEATITPAEKKKHSSHPLIFKAPVHTDTGLGGSLGKANLCDLCLNPAIKEKPEACKVVMCLEPALRYRQVDITPPKNSAMCQACKGTSGLNPLCGVVKCEFPVSAEGTVAYKRWLEVARVNVDQQRWAGVLSKQDQKVFLDAYKADSRLLQGR